MQHAIQKNINSLSQGNGRKSWEEKKIMVPIGFTESEKTFFSNKTPIKKSDQIFSRRQINNEKSNSVQRTQKRNVEEAQTA